MSFLGFILILALAFGVILFRIYVVGHLFDELQSRYSFTKAGIEVIVSGFIPWTVIPFSEIQSLEKIPMSRMFWMPFTLANRQWGEPGLRITRNNGGTHYLTPEDPDWFIAEIEDHMKALGLPPPKVITVG